MTLRDNIDKLINARKELESMTRYLIHAVCDDISFTLGTQNCMAANHTSTALKEAGFNVTVSEWNENSMKYQRYPNA